MHSVHLRSTTFIITTIIAVCISACAPATIPMPSATAPASNSAPTIAPATGTPNTIATSTPSVTALPIKPQPVRLRVLESAQKEQATVSLAPDGTRLASFSKDRWYLWNLATDQPPCALERSGWTELVWSPDGQFVFFNAHDVHDAPSVADAKTCATLRTFAYLPTAKSSSGNMQFPEDWSPDGKTLAVGHIDGRVLLRDAKTGTLLRALQGHTYNAWHANWSPDGTRLLSGAEELGSINNVPPHAKVIVWDLQTGKPQLSWQGYAYGNWSPDGSQIVLVGTHAWAGKYTIVDAQTGKEIKPFTLPEKSRTALQWSSAGLIIATVGQDKTQVSIYDQATKLYTLTGHSAPVWSIAISRDGSTIVCGLENGTIVLWSINPAPPITKTPPADVTTTRTRTPTPTRTRTPTGAPSTDAIDFAFTADMGNNVRRIYGLRDVKKGETPILLTPILNAWHPAIAPHGKLIAFESAVGGVTQIFTMDANGKNIRQLTLGNKPSFQPAFSPDGTRIIFASEREGETKIYVMNVDGSNQRKLAEMPNYNFAPQISTGFDWITFVSYRDGNAEIYIANADGTHQRRLTNNSVEDESPCFMLGDQILFHSKRNGHLEVYSMNRDGSNVRQLTRHPDNKDNCQPACSSWRFFAHAHIEGTMPHIIIRDMGTDEEWSVPHVGTQGELGPAWRR